MSHYGQIDSDWESIIVQYLEHLKFYSRIIPLSSNQSSVAASKVFRLLSFVFHQAPIQPSELEYLRHKKVFNVIQSLMRVYWGNRNPETLIFSEPNFWNFLLLMNTIFWDMVLCEYYCNPSLFQLHIDWIVPSIRRNCFYLWSGYTERHGHYSTISGCLSSTQCSVWKVSSYNNYSQIQISRLKIQFSLKPQKDE